VAIYATSAGTRRRAFNPAEDRSIVRLFDPKCKAFRRVALPEIVVNVFAI